MRRKENMNIFYDYQSIFRQRLGGVSRYHSELYRRINQFPGTTAFCKVFGSPNIYFEDILGYKSYDKYGYDWWFLDKANKISNMFEIRHKKYDIIHPTWYSPKAYDKSSKAKYVITIHDMIHEIYKGNLTGDIEGKRFWIHQADNIIAVSENTKKDILFYYPEINPEKITVIPLGTDKNIIPKQPIYQLPHRYILYVGGRDYEYKNFKRFLRVSTKILREYEDVDLLIVGGGDLNQFESQYLTDNKVNLRVHNVSADDQELAYIYRYAECFIYPSIYEGFGIPILEAFTNECPVVCSKASSFPEVAGEATLYFEPESDEDMYEKISQILTKPNMRKGLITKGLEQLELFSWDTMAEKTMNVYNK